MKRKIILIDESKCNGCGACAAACHEGAIGMVNGESQTSARRLLRRTGRLPARLPDGRHHLRGARSARLQRRSRARGKTRREKSSGRRGNAESAEKPLPCGCPGSQARRIAHKKEVKSDDEESASELSQWPVQIKLVPCAPPTSTGRTCSSRQTARLTPAAISIAVSSVAASHSSAAPNWTASTTPKS